MEPLTLQEVAQSCAGRLLRGAPEQCVRRVTTDSRTARPDDLFVALRGERFDGHQFIGVAASCGAAGILAEAARLPDPLPDHPIVAVPDSRRALGELAAHYRQKFGLPVVAVGGSNGKTTTKELLAAVLRQRFATLASEASFNNDVGVPLTLLKLERTHAAAVLEVGTNHPGELAPLLRMIQPRLGVLTSLGREHLEHFGDFAGVVAEEGALADALPPDGSLFVNADSPQVEIVVARSRAAVVCVGWGTGCAWRAEACRVDPAGTTFRVAAPRAEFSGEYQLRLLGRHQVTNALLALAVGAELGLNRAELQRGLAGCAPAPWRLEWQNIRGIGVLADCYNANADSTLAALAVLRDLPCAGRRIAVLGDMGELGRHSQAAHEEVGAQTAAHGVSELLAVGAMAPVLAGAARRAGLVAAEFADAAAAAAALTRRTRAGDLVLVKASRAAGLERVVDILKAGESGAG